MPGTPAASAQRGRPSPLTAVPARRRGKLMAWFNKTKAPIAPVETKKVQMPEGIWTKCKNCNEIIYTKEIERNLNVCPKCDYHFRISARERIALVLDEGSFVEKDAAMQSVDFLDF